MGYCMTCCAAVKKTDDNASQQFCSNACSNVSNRRTQSYNASSIRIRSDDDTMQDWELIPYLADKYTRDAKWIERSIQACREAGMSIDYFVSRYLDNDKSIKINQNVCIESAKIQRGMRHDRQ